MYASFFQIGSRADNKVWLNKTLEKHSDSLDITIHDVEDGDHNDLYVFPHSVLANRSIRRLTRIDSEDETGYIKFTKRCLAWEAG